MKLLVAYGGLGDSNRFNYLTVTMTHNPSPRAQKIKVEVTSEKVTKLVNKLIEFVRPKKEKVAPFE
ncbi:unnamed protein product [Dovyalis caffra]|uniref:Uncharacterized protein n=1 Tax=Dovyalis caffra TaxID=77055 RepID=A0AAV1S5I4_9ROSI|nr:unnamed protein product [Dovyalis caffra]